MPDKGIGLYETGRLDLHCCDGILNGLACAQGSREADCARQIAVGRSEWEPICGRDQVLVRAKMDPGIARR
jgi:hypothetical protein